MTPTLHEAKQRRQPNIQNQIWKSVLRVIGSVSIYVLAVECYGSTAQIAVLCPTQLLMPSRKVTALHCNRW